MTKFFSTLWIATHLILARTLGTLKYSHNVGCQGGGEVYEWRGRLWYFPVGPAE